MTKYESDPEPSEDGGEEMKANAESDDENMFDDLDGVKDKSKKQVVDGTRKRRDVPASGDDNDQKKYKNKGKVAESKMANKRSYKDARKKIKANKLKGKGLEGLS